MKTKTAPSHVSNSTPALPTASFQHKKPCDFKFTFDSLLMEVGGASWRGQFRCRGSRRESAVAQLSTLGGYTFMKNILLIILSGVVLCGCSKKHTASDSPAADRIVAGKDIIWRGGQVLHIEKRDGDSIEGIHIICATNVHVQTITADKGTIRRISKIKENGVIKSVNYVSIRLDEAHFHTSITNETVEGVMVDFFP